MQKKPFYEKYKGQVYPLLSEPRDEFLLICSAEFVIL